MKRDMKMIDLKDRFDYVIKNLFGTEYKIIQNCCNRLDMSCCGGGSSCCKSMFLHITNRCNANCFFCVAENKQDREIQDFAKLKETITFLVAEKLISKVVLTGGEPLMHSQFTRFLDLLDEFDLRYYSLNTNGTLLNDYLEKINASKLKHINISMHHHTDEVNEQIMRTCLSFQEVQELREKLSSDIEVRLACTITKYLHTKEDIMAYINKAKSIGVNNVIFRNEYKGMNKYLTAFQKMWGKLFTADICNCGVKVIEGVNAEYRESDTNLKESICQANLYIRDFIYKDDDFLSGSWNYGSQVIY